MALRLSPYCILLFGLGLTPASAQPAPDLIRLLDSSGVLGGLEEVRWSASGEMFDPAQTIVAGSRSRHITTYSVDGSWRPGEDATYEWSLNIHYPFPSVWNYSETMTAAGDGEIDGADGFRPSDGGPLPSARVGARAKFLIMTMPALVLAHADDVVAVPGQPDSYEFVAMDTRWRVHLDAASSVPTRLSTTENDPLFGTVESTMHYADWHDVESVRTPAQLEYRVDGQLIQQEFREEVELTFAGRARDVDYSPPLQVSAFSRGWNMAHWFLRRIALGGPADTDQSYPVNFLEIGEGVFQLLGSSHHSLVIETADGLVIADAPLYPSRSVAILEALAERWPDKPVQQVILTHHHYDHSGGVTGFAAAGIPIMTHTGNAEFFSDALAKQGLGTVPISSVGDAAEIVIGGRTIGLYNVPTSHVANMLMVYVLNEELIFNSDLYSPGRATQHQLWASELLQAVRFRGLAVKQFAGGHGQGTGSLEELEALGLP
jgi:glyoxylase-like metal-dependent hydrolase (beta-lactamase superfamily II)